MPDKAWKPDDWKKFSQGLQGETPADSGGSSLSPWGQIPGKAVEYGAAFGRGALKQAALAPGLQHLEPQSFVDWGKSTDPEHPDVEGAGRYVTPTNVMLGRLPDFTAGGRFALGPKASQLETFAYNIAQNAWKSTLGGAASADVDTPSGDQAGENVTRGAQEGLGAGLVATAGQAGLRMLPHWVLPAAIAAGELTHGRFMPWHIRHAIAAGLTAIAARAAKVPGGLMGVGGEAAAQKTGHERAGGASSAEPEDTIAPGQ